MAKACQCDRCKKLYPTYSDANHSKEMNGINSINGFKFSRRNTFNETIIASTHYDLCPDCLKELTEWFNNENHN